jgi:hypothetical protein
VDKFVHRLCLELHMTKADLSGRMSLHEMLDWAEYFKCVEAGGDQEDAAELTPEQIAAAFGAEVQHG